jgi:hypothetical protein
LEKLRAEIARLEARITKKPKAVVEAAQQPVDVPAMPDSPRSFEHPSFASDALGSGDLAAAIGETLDKFAQAIEEVHFELDRKHSPTIISSVSVDGSVSADEDEIVVPPLPEEITTDKEDGDDDDDENSTILNGAEDDAASQNSWHVVDEEQKQIQSDEALARAAQMVGSALFQSDATNQGVPADDSVSTSSSVSGATSVPTVVQSLAASAVGSVVSSSQLERWALQLNQLHEIGFMNDALSVGIMERLHAANLGCGMEEEITTTQVINEMMKRF